jgi:hypothetical protein
MNDLAWRVTRHGWFGFEGFGRPFEAWVQINGPYEGWTSLGRAFTWMGARKRARKVLGNYGHGVIS